jgi:hypothetical protein
MFIERSVPKRGCTAQQLYKNSGVATINTCATSTSLATKKMMNDQIDMFQLVTSNAFAELRKKTKKQGVC